MSEQTSEKEKIRFSWPGFIIGFVIAGLVVGTVFACGKNPILVTTFCDLVPSRCSYGGWYVEESSLEWRLANGITNLLFAGGFVALWWAVYKVIARMMSR